MKRILLCLLILFFSTGFLSPVLAQNTNPQQTTVTLAHDQIVNQDYFAAGNNVNLSGTVNGDAYLAGGNITIDGTVNGDLLAAGGNITITGKVTGSARVAGGQILFSGNVGRNLSAAGGNITLTENAILAGNLVSAGGTLIIENTVGKNVNAAIGNLILGSKAKVTKDLTYWSNNSAQTQQGAVVLGKTQQNMLTNANFKTPNPGEVTHRLAQASLFFRVMSFISYLLIGLLLLRFLPGLTSNMAETIKAHLGESLGIGFVIFILTPFLFILLLITVVGLPAAFIYLLFFLLLSYLSIIFVSVALGQKILGRRGSSYPSLLVGLLIYEILAFLFSIIGWLISLVFVMMGLGAMFRVIRTSRTQSLPENT